MYTRQNIFFLSMRFSSLLSLLCKIPETRNVKVIIMYKISNYPQFEMFVLKFHQPCDAPQIRKDTHKQWFFAVTWILKLWYYICIKLINIRTRSYFMNYTKIQLENARSKINYSDILTQLADKWHWWFFLALQVLNF